VGSVARSLRDSREDYDDKKDEFFQKMVHVISPGEIVCLNCWSLPEYEGLYSWTKSKRIDGHLEILYLGSAKYTDNENYKAFNDSQQLCIFNTTSRESHNKFYTCTARDTDKSRIYNLVHEVVLRSAQIEVLPNKAFYEYGETISLRCKDSIEKEEHVKWSYEMNNVTVTLMPSQENLTLLLDPKYYNNPTEFRCSPDLKSEGFEQYVSPSTVAKKKIRITIRNGASRFSSKNYILLLVVCVVQLAVCHNTLFII